MSNKKLIYFGKHDAELLEFIDDHIDNFSDFVREQVKLKMMQYQGYKEEGELPSNSMFKRIELLEKKLQQLTEEKSIELELESQPEEEENLDGWSL